MLKKYDYDTVYEDKFIDIYSYLFEELKDNISSIHNYKKGLKVYYSIYKNKEITIDEFNKEQRYYHSCIDTLKNRNKEILECIDSIKNIYEKMFNSKALDKFYNISYIDRKEV